MEKNLATVDSSEVITYLRRVGNVGEYVEYIPGDKNYIVKKSLSGYKEDQEFNLKEATSWRIFSIDENSVSLISTGSVGKLALKGYEGFLGAKYVLRDLCEAYVNPQFALYGISVSDVPRRVRKRMYERLKRDSVFMEMKYMVKNGLCIDEDVWIPSTFTIVNGNDYYYGVIRIYADVVTERCFLFEKHGEFKRSNCEINGVRPIIALKSNVEVIGGYGTKENPYKISIM